MVKKSLLLVQVVAAEEEAGRAVAAAKAAATAAKAAAKAKFDEIEARLNDTGRALTGGGNARQRAFGLLKKEAFATVLRSLGFDADGVADAMADGGGGGGCGGGGSSVRY